MSKFFLHSIPIQDTKNKIEFSFDYYIGILFEISPKQVHGITLFLSASRKFLPLTENKSITASLSNLSFSVVKQHNFLPMTKLFEVKQLDKSFTIFNFWKTLLLITFQHSSALPEQTKHLLYIHCMQDNHSMSLQLFMIDWCLVS